jgi:hypothetical protein
VFAYNHASWYVTKVLAIASTYSASAGLPPGAPAEEVAAAAVRYAYDKLGSPYQWGATGEQGFYDCSGLMQKAYEAGGLKLPRTSRDQWWFGARVWNVSDLEPGDLVFYAYNTADPATIHHVGIYIGAGNMIDAPYTGANVRITPFLRGDFVGAVRPTAGGALEEAAHLLQEPLAGRGHGRGEAAQGAVAGRLDHVLGRSGDGAGHGLARVGAGLADVAGDRVGDAVTALLGGVGLGLGHGRRGDHQQQGGHGRQHQDRAGPGAPTVLVHR